MRIAAVSPEAPSRNHEMQPGAPQQEDPELEALVREIIGRVADKWTMLALEVLSDHGRLRFTRLGELIGGVSQKMLTKTLRQMEADGLVVRTVFPVIPPRLGYELTELGRAWEKLSAAYGSGPNGTARPSCARAKYLANARPDVDEPEAEAHTGLGADAFYSAVLARRE